MCGIVGFITNEDKKGEMARANFLRQGLIVDTLRGDDSAGVFGVHNQVNDKGEVQTAHWAKMVSDGYEFVNSDMYGEHYHDVSGFRAAVGHNRAATVGAVDVAGAHPFVAGPITLVHNGTLTSTGHLPTPMYKLDDVVVDSHAIACNLAEHSVEDVVKELDGAFTLVWHDQRDDSINVIRNSKRPFHMTQAKFQDTIFFASEGPMLDFLTDRQNVECGPIYFPKEGQHLKWVGKCDLSAPQVKELDLYANDWGQYQGTGNRYGGYGTVPSYASSCGGYWDDALAEWVEVEDPYEDWRDAAKADGARRKGNVLALPTDDRLFLGGRRRHIPMLLQEELLKFDMVIEDRILFSPKVEQSSSVDSINVYGTVAEGEYKAHLLGTSVANKLHMNSAWMVRPIAVFYTPAGEPRIMVKLVNVHGIPAQRQISQENQGLSVMGYDIDANGEEMKYNGPYGQKYGAMDYHTMIAVGCGMCAAPIHPDDHAETEWVDNGRVPLCDICSDYKLVGEEE